MDRVRDILIEQKKEFDALLDKTEAELEIYEIRNLCKETILMLCNNFKIYPISTIYLKKCQWFMDFVTICNLVNKNNPDKKKIIENLINFVDSDSYFPCKHTTDYKPCVAYYNSLAKMFNNNKLDTVKLKKNEELQGTIDDSEAPTEELEGGIDGSITTPLDNASDDTETPTEEPSEAVLETPLDTVADKDEDETPLEKLPRKKRIKKRNLITLDKIKNCETLKELSEIKTTVFIELKKERTLELLKTEYTDFQADFERVKTLVLYPSEETDNRIRDILKLIYLVNHGFTFSFASSIVGYYTHSYGEKIRSCFSPPYDFYRCFQTFSFITKKPKSDIQQKATNTGNTAKAESVNYQAELKALTEAINELKTAIKELTRQHTETPAETPSASPAMPRKINFWDIVKAVFTFQIR